MVKRFQDNNAYGTHPTRPPICNNASSSVSMILYQGSAEAAPLLPGKTKYSGSYTSRLRQVGGWILALVVLFMAYHTSIHFWTCPPDPSTRDAIRMGWKNEQVQHAALERDWAHKIQEQAELEQGWKRDAERHENEVARRIREKYERQEKVRQGWLREIERHVRQFEEMQRREREERAREQERWRREVEERERHEEEERQRLHMYWGHVEPHICTTYATREYTAQLMNLPRTWTRRLDACRATPLEIHGISYLPTTCEDKGPGVVTGRWVINQREPECTPFWDSYHDKGCTSPGSRKKFITHKLENLPEKSDWREFCGTTPAHFDHMDFPGAQECIQSVWGVYGQWEIDDSNC